MIPGVILIIVGIRLYRKNNQKLRQEVEEQNRNQVCSVGEIRNTITLIPFVYI